MFLLYADQQFGKRFLQVPSPLFLSTLTLSVRELKIYLCKRLDPGQQPSNLAADLRSNLFATQSIIPHQKQA